ncbi:hypothetical protein LCGC14_1153990 [marine sediment metagenome]|uniref:Uncharacterized protein n=1 Tax=marine sediment metagenome TaxID=412755 RepID=A0A0F9LUM8_9ZZZZ
MLFLLYYLRGKRISDKTRFLILPAKSHHKRKKNKRLKLLNNIMSIIKIERLTYSNSILIQYG